MGRPDEIEEWCFAWASADPPKIPGAAVAHFPSLEAAMTNRERYQADGYTCGPIARHVTRAPWMKPKKKDPPR